MAEAASTESDAQLEQKVVASLNSEANIVAAEEEAEKAGASESKREEIKMLPDNAGNTEMSTIDKLDELSSLEQEIAKMHNIQSEQVEMKPQGKDAGCKTFDNRHGNKDAKIMDELPERYTPDNERHVKRKRKR